MNCGGVTNATAISETSVSTSERVPYSGFGLTLKMRTFSRVREALARESVHATTTIKE